MARKRSGKSYGDQMRAIANKYETTGHPWPATARQIAAWAIREGLWQPPAFSSGGSLRRRASACYARGLHHRRAGP